MKKKLLFSTIALAIIFALAYRFSNKSPVAEKPQPKAAQIVSVQTAKDSLELKQNLVYPATVVGDQEVLVTATSAGSALAVPFNLGDYVSAGNLLARIDNTGNVADTDYKNFQSTQVQQAHLSKELAEESWSLAKKNYKNLKKIYDKQEDDSTLAKTVSRTQVDAAKKQIDIAEIQIESARIDLRGALDNHLVTSPITGYITQKLLSVGDSVSVGQPVVTISQTKNIKFQFFVDAEHLATFSKGLALKVIGNNNKTVDVIVKNISPVADPETKRFLIEAYPKSATTDFLSGTLATVLLETTVQPNVKGNFILPLSAVTIGQNESYIFINEADHAKKTVVTLGVVKGETAEISADITPDTQIILDGSKLVSDGNIINIQE